MLWATHWILQNPTEKFAKIQHYKTAPNHCHETINVCTGDKEIIIMSSLTKHIGRIFKRQWKDCDKDKRHKENEALKGEVFMPYWWLSILIGNGACLTK